MDEIKAWISTLVGMIDIFDGHNENPNFVRGEVYWQHDFNHDGQLDEKNVKQMLKDSRAFSQWSVVPVSSTRLRVGAQIYTNKVS
jgi:hypothetical protein